MIPSRQEVAATVLEPYFDGARDVFAGYRPPSSDAPLSRVRRTKMRIDGRVFDGGRHFAGCRDDGLEVVLAPELIDLPEGTLLAIIGHELGHAADFAYPGRFATSRAQPALWIADPKTKQAAKWRKAWAVRSADQVEWAADSIVRLVTGRAIEYCGPCLIQCLAGGVTPRPQGVR